MPFEREFIKSLDKIFVRVSRSRVFWLLEAAKVAKTMQPLVTPTCLYIIGDRLFLGNPLHLDVKRLHLAT